MVKISVAAISIALFALSNLVFAQDDLAAIKLENTKLQAKLKTVSQEYQSVYEELKSVTADYSGIDDKLAAANAEVAMLRTKLEQSIDDASSREAELKQQLASASTGRDYLREKMLSMVNEPAAWAESINTSLSSIKGLDGTEVTTNKDGSVKIRVGNTGLFYTGGAELSSEGSELLDQIAEALAFRNDASITVIGHTDNIAMTDSNPYGTNLALSFARASSTLQHLRAAGLSADQLSAAGHGEDYPIASNDYAEGRQMNRRVEMMLKQR